MRAWDQDRGNKRSRTRGRADSRARGRGDSRLQGHSRSRRRGASNQRSSRTGRSRDRSRDPGGRSRERPRERRSKWDGDEAASAGNGKSGGNGGASDVPDWLKDLVPSDGGAPVPAAAGSEGVRYIDPQTDASVGFGGTVKMEEGEWRCNRCKWRNFRPKKPCATCVQCHAPIGQWQGPPQFHDVNGFQTESSGAGGGKGGKGKAEQAQPSSNWSNNSWGNAEQTQWPAANYSDTSHLSADTLMCSVHKRKRTIRNLEDDGAGGLRCGLGNECDSWKNDCAPNGSGGKGKAPLSTEWWAQPWSSSGSSSWGASQPSMLQPPRTPMMLQTSPWQQPPVNQQWLQGTMAMPGATQATTLQHASIGTMPPQMPVMPMPMGDTGIKAKAAPPPKKTCADLQGLAGVSSALAALMAGNLV